VLERILPDAVRSVEAGEDRDAGLHPDEECLIARAGERRRREFATGRACAHRALAALGRPAAAILAGPAGEPLWPAGVVGSIAHCEGFRACAVAAADEFLTIGIDAEPDRPLPQGVLGRISTAAQRELLDELSGAAPGRHWDRLLFVAKEALFKAWFPLVGRLDLAEIGVAIDPFGGFSARLPAAAGREPDRLDGRWLAERGLLVAAAAPRAGA